MHAVGILVLSASLVCGSTIPRRNVLDGPPLNPDTVPGFKVVPPPLHAGLFDKNGKLQAVTSNGNYSAPKATVPDVQIEPAKNFKDASRKKIRYGPFRLPGTKVSLLSLVLRGTFAHNSTGGELAIEGNEALRNG
jgi:hypothetical protein